jgi:hypothetical protein
MLTKTELKKIGKLRREMIKLAKASRPKSLSVKVMYAAMLERQMWWCADDPTDIGMPLSTDVRQAVILSGYHTLPGDLLKGRLMDLWSCDTFDSPEAVLEAAFAAVNPYPFKARWATFATGKEAHAKDKALLEKRRQGRNLRSSLLLSGAIS